MKSIISKSVFVTGTDTGVGKTMIVGLLTRFLYESGWRVITQKWVQTGVGQNAGDLQKHWQWMGRKEFKKYFLASTFPEKLFSQMQPYVFKLPASPYLAAKVEGKVISGKKIKQDFILLSKDFNWVIVEGSGGVLVPFNNKEFLIDLAKDLSIPVLVVVGNKLGAINHAVLTIEALKQRQIKILGLIFNTLSAENDRVILDENIKTVHRLTRIPVLGELPFLNNDERLHQHFKPIGFKIVNALKRNK